MQPAHGSIRLPCAAMKGLSHFQQFHAAVRAHHRLLPISPVRFQVDVSIRTIIARNGQKLPFQESQPPAAVYDDLRLSVIVHHPCTAIFQTNRRPVRTGVEHFLVSRHHCHSVSTPQSPQSATSVMESFQNRECILPLFLIKQIPVPDRIQQLSMGHHHFPFFLPPAFLQERTRHGQPVFRSFPRKGVTQYPPLEHRFPVPLTDGQTEYPVQPHIIYQHTGFLITRFP